MKKKDIILIVGLIALALALLVCGLALRSKGTPAKAEPEGDEVSLASDYSQSVRESAAEYFEEYPAESYLLVRVGGGVYTPIPLNGENAFRIAQADGSENVIHIGENSFYMESSNCDNQNCVQQGEVTLENRDTRLLFNMIICLPHNLSLEMLTREEAENLLLEMYAQEETAKAAEG